MRRKSGLGRIVIYDGRIRCHAANSQGPGDYLETCGSEAVFVVTSLAHKHSQVFVVVEIDRKCLTALYSLSNWLGTKLCQHFSPKQAGKNTLATILVPELTSSCALLVYFIISVFFFLLQREIQRQAARSQSSLKTFHQKHKISPQD